MPVKRRATKHHRFPKAEELLAWGEYFELGSNGFAGEMEGIGVTDPVAEVEAAWHRLGAEWLSQFVTHSERCVPWALKKFGQPKGALRAR